MVGIKGLAVAVAGVCATLAMAQAAAGERVYTYAVSLDGDGRVTEVARHAGPADALAAELQARVGSWTFAPAVAAAGAPSRTFVRIEASDEGGLAELRNVTTGPAPARLSAPEYARADQRAGREGVVVLKLSIDADGRVADVAVDRMAGEVSRTMAVNAVQAARGWSFAPETVAGRPVASTLLWPVCYRARSSDESTCSWQGPGESRLGGNSLVVLEPSVRVVAPQAVSVR